MLSLVIQNKNVFYGVYGVNSTLNNGHCLKTIHAECDVINKIKKNHKKRLIKINITVVRLGRKGDKFKFSKPCSFCLKYLEIISKKKGYIIDYIYYSNSEGEIIGKKFIELLNEKNKHISAYFKFINNN